VVRGAKKRQMPKSTPAPAPATITIEEAGKRPSRSTQRESRSQHRTIDDALIARQDLPSSKAGALLTARETAELLHFSISWLAKSRMRGDGPPFLKFGRSVRYREEHLVRWTKSHLRLSTTD
jgi:Helix-turn-helix domain